MTLMDRMNNVDREGMGDCDPINEIVFFSCHSCWNIIGPLTCNSARNFLNIFKQFNIPAFVCLENEYLEKGIPAHPDAREYFDNISPGWLSRNMQS